jgi:hypothetical protein
MQMNMTFVGLAAQNYAGKTGFATRLAGHGMTHYSVREAIRQEHHALCGYDIKNTSSAFTAFGEAQRKERGCHIFIEKPIKRFMVQKKSGICIIESFRARGEAIWFMEKVPQEYPGVKTVLIGITAPYDQRLGRSLVGRPDQLDAPTKESFDHREMLVNRGVELWEESVEGVLSLPGIKKFENLDGKFEETFTEMHHWIKLQAS